MTYQKGFKFKMPLDTTMEIHSSKEIDDDIGVDKEIDDVVYTIHWEGITMPWCANTYQTAMAMAVGCQWGAEKMLDRVSLFLNEKK